MPTGRYQKDCSRITKQLTKVRGEEKSFPFCMREKIMKRVNVCGVPEEAIKEGRCDACGTSVCDMMDDSLFVDKRVYDYAKRNKMPCFCGHYYRMFQGQNFSEHIKKNGMLEKVPKYIRNYIAALDVSK